jgi:hypothetical protein
LWNKKGFEAGGWGWLLIGMGCPTDTLIEIIVVDIHDTFVF